MTRNRQHAIRPAFHFSLFAAYSPVFWFSLALLLGLFYLAVSAWGFGYFGFPLDDAWIHQTYARNLARSGQLAFTPGVPSAGSTAPLWTLLLSLGYLLGVPFKWWTYGLGIIFLALTGWSATRLGRRLFPQQRWVGLWAGLFCLFEWHLAWAAVSGMETMLFIWLSLFVFERYLAAEEPGWQPAFILGILGGLLALTRPEGLGLVGLIGLDMAFRCWRVNDTQYSILNIGRQVASGKLQVKNLLPAFCNLQRWVVIVSGITLLLVPYISFHLYLTGLPFPNTLYAKQTEYGIILQTFSLWWRLFGNFGPPIESVQGVFRVIFIGAQVLLLPGLLLAGWLTWRERRFELLPAWLWWISYLLLYGLRLPVTYQHGRYQIPAIPWVILLGVWGTLRLVNLLAARGMWGRVTGRALALSLGLLLLAFTGVGAQAYGRDVRFIESEMVAAAQWLGRHASPGALVAAHDIGAIGYFTQTPLIDLAGLVTPEVIPIIRDEPALLELILARRADYLVTFPSWYPEMTRSPRLDLLYSTQAPWAPQAGGENMAIYRVKPLTGP